MRKAKMERLFLLIVDLSRIGSVFILIFLCFHRLFQKLPKVFSYCIWVLIFFKLIFPFTLDSKYAVLPATIKPTIRQEVIPKQVNEPNVDNIVVPTEKPVTQIPRPEKRISLLTILAFIWILGVMSLCVYSYCIYIRIKRKLKSSYLFHDAIYISDYIAIPFVCGFLHPKIYVPDSLQGEESVEYVIAHEQVHIQRKDHMMKPITFVIACIHWFNPLVWIAYAMLSKDIEMACDEKVIQTMNGAKRKAYASALLTMSTNQSFDIHPLAFNGGSIKARIRNIKGYKKSKRWIYVVLIFLVTTLGVCMLVNQPTKQESENEVIKENWKGRLSDYKNTFSENEANTKAVFAMLDFQDATYVASTFVEGGQDKVEVSMTIQLASDKTVSSILDVSKFKDNLLHNSIVLFYLQNDLTSISYQLQMQDKMYYIHSVRENIKDDMPETIAQDITSKDNYETFLNTKLTNVDLFANELQLYDKIAPFIPISYREQMNFTYIPGANWGSVDDKGEVKYRADMNVADGTLQYRFKYYDVPSNTMKTPINRKEAQIVVDDFIHTFAPETKNITLVHSPESENHVTDSGKIEIWKAILGDKVYQISVDLVYGFIIEADIPTS